MLCLGGDVAKANGIHLGPLIRLGKLLEGVLGFVLGVLLGPERPLQTVVEHNQLGRLLLQLCFRSARRGSTSSS